MTASWKPDPDFVERFARRRELFVAGLTGIAAKLQTVKCRPIDSAFTFGWAFEQGDTGHPSRTEGGIDYALSYLRHMIDQGFVVAYAVSLAEGGMVHLQAWESHDDQKPWPSDPEIVVTSVWQPMRASGRSGKVL